MRHRKTHKSKEKNYSKKTGFTECLQLIHPRKVLKRSITVADLCDLNFWNEMLFVWHECYQDVRKISKGPYDLSKVKGIKDLQNIALKKYMDDNPTVLDQLKTALDNGSLNENTHKALRKKLCSLICQPLSQYRNELIDELDYKTKAVVEQFMIQI